jgi:hypothetical protein
MITNNKKILLLEPNSYHSELIPGIAKYFNDLEYDTDIFVQPLVLKDNPFCWRSCNIHIQVYDLTEVKQLLSSEKITTYDFIFFSSMEFTLNGDIFNIIQYLGFIPKAKYGILGIYHTTSHIDLFHDYQLMAEGRFFCISDFQIQNYNLSVLNPHYYGETGKNESNENSSGLYNKNDNSIICIGNAFDENMLLNAIYQIHKQNRQPPKITYYGGKSPAVFQKINRFIKGIIILLLSLFNTTFLKKHLFRKYVVKKGRVSFDELFNAILRCKYILVLINPHAPEHEHYVTYTTSGIRQIILGFKKVPIVHEEVAVKYNFDRTNSILYDDTNLDSALLPKQNNYQDMVDSLSRMADSVYRYSYTNLKNAIAKIISFAP